MINKIDHNLTLVCVQIGNLLDFVFAPTYSIYQLETQFTLCFQWNTNNTNAIEFGFGSYGTNIWSCF